MVIVAKKSVLRLWSLNITTSGTDYREVAFIKTVWKPAFGFPGRLHNLHGESICK